MFGQLPRRCRLDVLIRLRHHPHDRLERCGELDPLHRLLHRRRQADRGLPERLILHRAADRGRRGDRALTVPLQHRADAVHQVAQIVRQIRVEPAQEGALGEIAVLPERHIPQQEIPVDVRSVRLAFQHLAEDHRWVHDVAERLRHLLLADLPPSMGKDHLRHLRIREAEHVQDDGPVDRVVAQDILADELHVRRPEAGKSLRIGEVPRCRHVVQERVKPDIRHMIRTEWHGDPPGHPRLRPREAERLRQRAAEEAGDLVVAGGGPDKIRMRLDELGEPWLRGPHRQVPPLFRHRLERPLTGGTGGRGPGLRELRVGPERLIRRAVPALVGRVRQLAVIVQLGEGGLDDLHVARLGCPDEVVVRDVQRGPERLEMRHHLVDERLGRFAGRGGGLRDLLAVLIGAGEQEGIIPPRSVKADQAVGGDAGVGVADMRGGVHVVERRGDVVGLSHQL